MWSVREHVTIWVGLFFLILLSGMYGAAAVRIILAFVLVPFGPIGIRVIAWGYVLICLASWVYWLVSRNRASRAPHLQIFLTGILAIGLVHAAQLSAWHE